MAISQEGATCWEDRTSTWVEVGVNVSHVDDCDRRRIHNFPILASQWVTTVGATASGRRTRTRTEWKIGFRNQSLYRCTDKSLILPFIEVIHGFSSTKLSSLPCDFTIVTRDCNMKREDRPALLADEMSKVRSLFTIYSYKM